MCFLDTTWPKCLLHKSWTNSRMRFTNAFYTHTKVLFTYENAFCTCFLQAQLIFLHTTWPTRFVHRNWKHTRMLFTNAFHTHQSAFYIRECFLHMLFTRTNVLFRYKPSACYISLEQTPECVLQMLFTHTLKCFSHIRMLFAYAFYTYQCAF